MGTFIKGILGGFSGKIGNVIGAFHRGVDYMRSLPRKSNKPATLPQLTQRLKFKTVVGFLRPVTAFIRVGYQLYKGKESPFNAAVAYHLEKAVTGIYPNLTIDLPEVVLSKGQLLAAASPEVETTLAGQVKFNWEDNSPVGSTNGTDKATVCVYNPVKNLFVALQGAAARSVETFVLHVPGDFSGDTVHCWISFVSANGKEACDSVYLGTVPVI